MPILGVIASSKLTATAAESYESIATVTVGGTNVSSITLSSIPATFTHLQLRYFSLNTNNDTTVFQVNGDTGGNYSLHVMNGSGSSPVTTGGTVGYTFGSFGVTSGVANTFAAGIVDFLDYANTNKYKTIRGLSGRDFNGSGNIQLRSTLWRDTAAISSITTTTDSNHPFTQYTKFALYGIKGV